MFIIKDWFLPCRINKDWSEAFIPIFKLRKSSSRKTMDFLSAEKD